MLFWTNRGVLRILIKASMEFRLIKTGWWFIGCEILLDLIFLFISPGIIS